MMFRIRYISLNLKELYFKDLSAQLKIISNILKNHYKMTKSLPIFGDIAGYNTHF